MFIDNCSDTPSGTTPTFLMCIIDSIVMGDAHLCYTSFSVTFYRASALRADLSDLCFPLSSIGYRYYFLVASSIGDRW